MTSKLCVILFLYVIAYIGAILILPYKSMSTEQLTKFVATVVIQVAQPQVCYPNPKQDMLDLKSSMCRKISNAAKNILKVGITGKELFESIGSLSAPAPPPPPKTIYIYECQSELGFETPHQTIHTKIHLTT